MIIGPPPPSPRRFDELFARFVDERAFGLVEVLVVCVILIVVAVGLVGVLTSSIAATAVAAERTKAEQCAGDQVEQIRRKAYDSVGLVAGNPPGTVPPTAPCGNSSLAVSPATCSNTPICQC